MPSSGSINVSLSSLPEPPLHSVLRFFFNDTATTEIYTLSLHDLFRSRGAARDSRSRPHAACHDPTSSCRAEPCRADRKSTRLNSSHSQISYAVFCLKKKKYESNAYVRKRDNNSNLPQFPRLNSPSKRS